MPNRLPTNAQTYATVPRRGSVALVTTVLAVILLFSFKTSDPPGAGVDGPGVAVIGSPPAGQTAPPVAIGPGATPTPRLAPGATPAPTPPPGTDSGGSASGTFTGNAVRTQYGTVQVAIVVKGGKIVDVNALQLPSDRRLSQQISNYAAPLLHDEVLAAQSANIDGVSGATYTSDGYDRSLQSAIAQVP